MSGYLLCSDFDNTICFWSNVGWIRDEDRAAIRRFREAGNKFVIVSGRSYQSAIDVFDTMDFHDMDFFMIMSGAYAAYPDESLIFDKRIDMRTLPPLADFFRETGARYLCLDIGKESYNVDIGGDLVPEFTSPITVEKALEFPTYTSINVGYHSIEESCAVAEELNKRFSHIITPLPNNRAIDMPPAGINKAVAVDYAAKMYGIEKDKIYTAGDNYNDIQMLKAYHGCAMANGPRAVWDSAERKITYISEIIDHILSL
ncbi:MAG: HAD hydrolase family protein [Clostridia bacterium]|nr:HAD hydrolase family protein [Clostridia bacterium]